MPPLANAPLPDREHGPPEGDAKAAAAATGARTVPPREHGGNCDIKDLSRGARIFFPVYVPGAGLSMGDLHFSQGDGEITFCGAIEMPGWIHLNVELIKGGMAKYGIKNPIFKPGRSSPLQRLLDLRRHLGRRDRRAVLPRRARGLSTGVPQRDRVPEEIRVHGAQAYRFSGAPVEGRISGVVDIPNSCGTLWLPTAIFDFDINPGSDGPIGGIKAGVDMPLAPDL